MKESHSYGIILFNNNQILMVCRKDSIGFCEFLKGKYKNEYELKKLFSLMTKYELEIIISSSFEDLWDILWNTSIIDIINTTNLTTTKPNTIHNNTNNYIMNYKNKFDLWRDIWHPICINLLDKRQYYLTAEWGFPKGKKERGETGIQTALRELYEETNISKNMVEIIDEKPLVEIRKDGHLKFISHYYLATVKNDIDNNEYDNDNDNGNGKMEIKDEGKGEKKRVWDNFVMVPQKNEISEIRFIDIKDAAKLIRPYFVERINILNRLKNKQNSFE